MRLSLSCSLLAVGLAAFWGAGPSHGQDSNSNTPAAGL